jgi:hypothetical protein
VQRRLIYCLLLFLCFLLPENSFKAVASHNSHSLLSKDSPPSREIEITNRLREISLLQMERREKGLPEDKKLSQEWDKLAKEWSTVKKEREKLMEKVLDSPDLASRPAYQKLRP